MCCEHLPHSASFASPLTRIIVVEWYDGPVTGAALCGECGAELVFRMVAWDDEQTMRVYTLADLPEGHFEKLSSVFAVAGPATWPVWWPANFPSENERDRSWRGAQALLGAAAAPTCVVAAEALEATILKCSRLSSGEELPANLDRSAFEWWMSRLQAA